MIDAQPFIIYGCNETRTEQQLQSKLMHSKNAMTMSQLAADRALQMH